MNIAKEGGGRGNGLGEKKHHPKNMGWMGWDAEEGRWELFLESKVAFLKKEEEEGAYDK